MLAVGSQQLIDLSFDIDVYPELRDSLGQLCGQTGSETGQDNGAIPVSNQPLVSDVY